ncbi:unnamed protein product [Malus baccata var. baccata]
MWYDIVLISESSDNNAPRYGSNLQNETKAISQALIHGIMASLTIPLYGLIVGSYLHKVDLQYLIGCITLLETWWQDQVGVFNGFVTSYFPYCFWTSNLLTEHDAKAFENDEETRILLAHSPDMLLAMKWVILVQHALSLAIFNAIYLPQELVVGDATKLIVLFLNAVKISYLAKLHDFIFAGYELMILVFLANTEYEYGTPLDKLAGLFPDCCMCLSQFGRLEDKPHLKGVGLMRL